MPPKKEMKGSDEKTCNDWSTLALDLIRSVLERLSFVDFQRARCVSSEWYSVSKSCIKLPTNPWLILFPDEHEESNNNNNGSCKLFDPFDNKTYIVRDLGSDFATSHCLSNYGSWFLMLDHRTDLYLLNLFTRERILLPFLESVDGSTLKFKRISDSNFLVTSLHYKARLRFSSENHGIKNAVLWVDEKSRDYLVVWSFYCFFAYHKKGDDSWRVFYSLENKSCVDMVFKDSKLYVLSQSENISVFDLIP